MGLLEQKLKGLLSYIDANTPRATRPVAKPSQVINQGLINPNKYNEPAASRFKDSAFGLLGVVPGLGDAASAVESADLFNRGEKFAGSMAALGALPIVPALGGIFIGKGAKTWDFLKAQQAEELLAKGVDPREVWKQTGTLKGVDGALRQEIPDNAAAFTKNGVRDLKDYGARKESSIFSHDDLYAAYPDTADLVALRSRGNDYSGYYTDQGDNIGLTFPDKKPDMESLKSLNVHELQHAIQQREGWARGGSPDELAKRYQSAQDEYDLMFQTMKANPERADEIRPILDRLRNEYRDLANPNEAYRRLAGEAEARLTQSRMGLDAAQRLQHYPYDMGQYGLDVPLDSLIVRGLLDGPAMSKADEAGGLLGKSANVPDMSYQIDHKPLTVAGGASTLDDLTGAFGEDIYGKNALQYFGSGAPEERTTLKILQSMRGKPDELVSIYRGVPDGVNDINPGDWVTLDKNVAQMYADPTAYGEGTKGAGKVIELKVPARSITSWPDSLLEFGYYPD